MDSASLIQSGQHQTHSEPGRTAQQLVVLPGEIGQREFHADILLTDGISLVWLEFNTELSDLKKNVLS